MSTESEILLAVKVWAAAAWADGVIVDEEAKGMEAVISVSKLSDEEKERARGWLKNKVELEDINVSQIPPDNRANIYAAALGVVSIDEDVAASEEKFLERLQIALQIDDDTAAQLRKASGV